MERNKDLHVVNISEERLPNGIVWPDTRGSVVASRYHISILIPDDLKQAHRLEVAAGAELGKGYRVYNPAELLAIIDLGLSFGGYLGEELVAFRLVRKPDPIGEALATVLGIMSNDASRIAYLAGSYVLPEHRRQGLANLLTARAIDRAEERGFEQLFVTVAPGNIPNLANLFKLGFVIKGVMDMPYGTRYILDYSLTNVQVSLNEERELIPEEALLAQRELCEQGYVGESVRVIDEQVFMVYTRKVNVYDGVA